jgi:hypothetical protein
MVNLAIKEYPNSTFGPIILGGLAGCGGTILLPYFLAIYNGVAVPRSELSDPGLYYIFYLFFRGSQLPFLLSIFYFISKVNGIVYQFDIQKIHVVLSPEVIVGLANAFILVNTIVINSVSSLFGSEKSEKDIKKEEPRKEAIVTKTKNETKKTQ